MLSDAADATARRTIAARDVDVDVDVGSATARDTAQV